MTEIWKDIPGFNGYQVSNLGNFKSFKRNKCGRYLKTNLSKKGYLNVHLRVNGKSSMYKCHRLVLITFDPIPHAEQMEVNHKNENKQDNRLENLEWMTHIENVRYGTGIQRKSLIQSEEIVCVELNTTFNSMKEASETTGINYGNISSCCNGKLNTAGGYHWSFVNSRKRNNSSSDLLN